MKQNHLLLKTKVNVSCNNFTSTYKRVSNFGQHFHSKLSLQLKRGSTYMRVYTVHSEIFSSSFLSIKECYFLF